MKLALVGAGARGMIYSRYAHDKLGDDIVAVADRHPEKLERAHRLFGTPEEMLFTDPLELIRTVPEADALIVASMDRDHYAHAMAGLDRGWHLLLEKPISPDPLECLKISRKATEMGLSVTVCHVLRYSPFFVRLKEILDSGELGKIICIDHTENVGNFHIAHSFVRGNWRNSDLASPIIMQKSCHDLDILLWLTGKRAVQISSFGSLTYFRPENAPEGSAERCLDCAVAERCRFDARKAYLPAIGSWPTDVLTQDQTEEGVLKALRDGRYGRCVYHCDNNVCDHQSTLIEFEDGITATFTLSGMTNRICRTIHVMCENGELWGDDGKGEIRISPFRSNNVDGYQERVIHIGAVSGDHSGGDQGLMEDFSSGLHHIRQSDSRSSVQKSVESHLMACAAEKSRLSGQTVNMAEYEKELLQNL